jgi:ABC-type glycerol-3-phosphate transport system substrate-binding protein
MQRNHLSSLVAALFLSLGAAMPALAVTEVELHHELDRVRGEKLSTLVESFNSQSKDYKVKVVQQSNDTPCTKSWLTRR